MWVSGFRGSGSGCRVHGLGFRAEGARSPRLAPHQQAAAEQCSPYHQPAPGTLAGVHTLKQIQQGHHNTYRQGQLKLDRRFGGLEVGTSLGLRGKGKKGAP